MDSTEDLITVSMPDVDIDFGLTSCMADTTFSFDSDTIVLGDLDYDNYGRNVVTDYDKGTITLNGPSSDITMDGVSLKDTLKGINDRLAILQVNPALEAEFDELHALGEQYRALEHKLLEKKAVWDALNGS